MPSASASSSSSGSGGPAPTKKLAHLVGADLKAVKELVPQLEKDGFQRWHLAMTNIASMLSWCPELMDITKVYDMSSENETQVVDRTVAWMLMRRTIEGHEDLIETQLQAGTNDFNLAFKCIHDEYNRATTGHVNTMVRELFALTMTQSQTSVRQFSALIVRKANRLKTLGGGDTNEAQLLSIFMGGLPMPDYAALQQHLRFNKTTTLADATTRARDFAVSEGLENEAGQTRPSHKKQPQMFFGE